MNQYVKPAKLVTTLQLREPALELVLLEMVVLNVQLKLERNGNVESVFLINIFLILPQENVITILIM
jgi:hypothetical protein